MIFAINVLECHTCIGCYAVMNVGLLFEVQSAMVLWWLFVISANNFQGCFAVMNMGLLFEVKSAMVVCSGCL